MIELNEIKRLDKSGLLNVIRDMPEHCRDSVLRASKVSIPDDYEDPEKIHFMGMGACYTAGRMLTDLLSDELTIPISVSADYTLSKHIDNKTLVFIISYSGNTDESVSSFMEAVKRRCRIIAVSSGGQIEKLCSQYKVPFIKIPEKLTSRGSIIYLMFSVLESMRKLRIIDKIRDMQECINVLVELNEKYDPAYPVERNSGKLIAESIRTTMPVTVSSGALSSVAMRWKNDFVENAKNHAFYNILPEMNHNDLVPYEFGNPNLSIIFLRSDDEPAEIKKRFEATKKLVEGKVKCVHEIQAAGKSKLAKAISLIYISSTISFYLGILNGVDPTPVHVVEELTKLRRS
jgi:glucose/mannose-6-phosphate isomerase